MGEFWKGAAAVLLAAVLGLVLDQQQKDLSALLSIGVCVLIGRLILHYLEPVVDFLLELEAAGGMQEHFLGILLKAMGVGMTSELAGMVCTDAGKASLGKSLQMLGSAVILYLSVPVFQSMLNMVRQILGGI